MRDIDTLTPQMIESIYKAIIIEFSPSDWKNMRTPEYWVERDSMRSDTTRKRVTIKFYHKYKCSK